MEWYGIGWAWTRDEELTRPRSKRINHKTHNQTHDQSTNRSNRDGGGRFAERDTADEDDGFEAFAEDGDEGEEEEDPAGGAGAGVDACRAGRVSLVRRSTGGEIGGRGKGSEEAEEGRTKTHVFRRRPR